MRNLKRFFSIILIESFLLNLLFVEGISAQEKPKNLTVAVVDFTNIKNDPAFDYLVKGIPESIITYLGKRGRVRIVERARLKSALEEMQLAQTGVVDEQKAVEIGKAVGADAVIVGSFLQIGDIIRINARLIDVKTSEIKVAEQVQGKPGTELFDLMDRTAASMEVKLLGGGTEQILNIQPIPGSQPGSKKEPKKEGKSLFKKWWFWGILGAGAAGGAAFALKSKEKEKQGTILISIDLP